MSLPDSGSMSVGRMPRDQILARASGQWLDFRSDCQVRPGDVCWIEATPDGRMIGQEVLERRQLLAPLAVT